MRRARRPRRAYRRAPRDNPGSIAGWCRRPTQAPRCVRSSRGFYDAADRLVQRRCDALWPERLAHLVDLALRRLRVGNENAATSQRDRGNGVARVVADAPRAREGQVVLGRRLPEEQRARLATLARAVV